MEEEEGVRDRALEDKESYRMLVVWAKDVELERDGERRKKRREGGEEEEEDEAHR